MRLDWWRKWERLNQGGGGTELHNKPVGCGASEAYAPGPDGEEEEGKLHSLLTIVTGIKLHTIFYTYTSLLDKYYAKTCVIIQAKNLKNARCVAHYFTCHPLRAFKLMGQCFPVQL